MTTSTSKPSLFFGCWRWWCGWPSDVCLWAGIIVLVAMGLLWWRGYLRIINPDFGPQRLLLHSTDANDVKPGANVYFMGVLVGTIEEVRIPFNTHRYDVAMVANTRRKLPTLPDNIEGYIVFNGLAGAKEVHLVPPEKPVWTPHNRRSHQFINIENPIRLRDVMRTNMEVNEYLQLGAESFSDFLAYGSPSSSVRDQIIHMQNNVDTANAISLEATQQNERLIAFFNKLEPTLHKALTSTNNTLAPVSKYANRINRAMDATLEQHPLSQTKATLDRTHTTVKQARQQLDNLNHRLKTLQPTFNSVQRNLALFNLQGGVQPIPQKLEATHTQLQQFRLWLEEHLPPANYLTNESETAPLDPPVPAATASPN